MLSKLETKLDQLPMDKLGTDGAALLAELRQSNQRLGAISTIRRSRPCPEIPTRRCSRPRKLIEDPNLASAIAHMQRTLSRLDRIIGGGESDRRRTLENMRQISDNLRDLTENAKRYPSGVLLGEPPPPAKGAQ